VNLRRLLLTFVTAVGASLVLAPGAADARDLVIRDVNVISMTSPEVLRHRTVVVQEGVITSIDADSAAGRTPDAQIVDGSGKYLLPGLCDMHVHVGSDAARDLPAGSNFDRAIQDTQAELLVYLRAGVTCLRNMSGSPFHLALVRQIESGAVLGPRLLTTTPIVDGVPPVWPFAITVAKVDDVRPLIRSFKAQGYDTVKVYNGLSRDVYDAIVVSARAAGMKVVGHVPFSAGIWGALAVKQDSIEHFRGYDFNPAMAPGASSASNRFAWWASLTDADLVRLARATADAGVYNCPTIHLMELAVRGAGRAALERRPEVTSLPAAVRARVLSDHSANLFSEQALKAMRDSLPVQQRLLLYMLKEGAPILAGTDTPALASVPGSSLHRELELIAASGAGNFEALRAATTTPARYFARGGEKGTVEVGQRADLVLLNADPLESVSHVRDVAGIVLRGKWLSTTDMQHRLDALAR
jgi:imidazolonepropionase-like amidohydrolase